MPRSAVMLALFLPVSAFGQNPQYRKLKLTDGREIRAEVLATEATGLRMRIPQGETLVSFEILMDMVPIDPNEYRDQDPVRVWVQSASVADELRRIYAAVPNLVVVTPNEPQGLTPGQVLQLEGCNDDFDCMAGALSADTWMWFVTAAPPADATNAAQVVRGRTSGGPPIHRVDSATSLIPDLWVAAHEAIQVIPPTTIPKTVTGAAPIGPQPPDPRPPREPRDGWTAKRAAQITPTRLLIPGLSSFQQGDGGRGALGLGIAAVGTGAVATVAALSVQAPASSDVNPKPGISAALFGVGTWVALSAFTNTWLGSETYDARKVGLQVTPTPGGAVVGMSGRL